MNVIFPDKEMNENNSNNNTSRKFPNKNITTKSSK